MTPRITEAAFTAQVIEYARLHRWRVAHFRAGRTATGWRTPVSGDGVGFPDLLLLRGGRRLVAELKLIGKRPRAEQVEWLRAFEAAGVPAYVFTPADWAEIEEVLR